MPAYSKTTWVNGTTPAINATNLNKIEQGIADAVRKDGSEAMTAQLVTVAGSAATPAIAPTGDANTGIFFPAADTIAFGEGGLEAMRINSSGNVGIGTQSPSTKLDASGSVKATLTSESTSLGNINSGLIVQRSANDSQAFFDYRSTPDAWVIGATYSSTGTYKPIAFATSDNERMRITSAGNVGIGTTSPVSVSGYTILTINNSTNGGAINFQENGATRGEIYCNSTRFQINGLNSRSLTLGVEGVEKARIDYSTGYLLIGYTSSNGAYPLQVNGQIFATSSTIATSDGRYKKDVVSLDGALDIVKALNPVQFSWKDHPVHKFNTDVPTVGFIAQEVAEVLKDKAYLTSLIKKSECTWETETGETIEREVTRDVEKQVTREVEREITETIDGEEVTRTVTEEVTETVIEQVTEIVSEPVKETHTEEFLGIAESNLIAILTKAVKELTAKVEALEARI